MENKAPKSQIENSLLPEWSRNHIKIAEWYIKECGWQPTEVLSTEKDFMKWDICFKNPQIPMFIAIFEDRGTVYYHIDCGILNLTDLSDRDRLNVIDFTCKKIWNLLVEYKVAVNNQGHLSVNILGQLRKATPSFFKHLLSEIVPYAQFLNKEIKEQFN